MGVEQMDVMTCHYHLDRESVTQCELCGKNLCYECIRGTEDKVYCKECSGKIEFPIEMKNIIFPAVLCGIIGGFLSAAPTGVLNCVFCMLVVLAGGITVYLAKSASKIKGRISTGKAAFAGGLAGFVSSIAMWISFWSGIRGFRYLMPGELEDIGAQQVLIDAGIVPESIVILTFLLYVLVTAVVFSLFGMLGGIVSNELTK